MISLNRVLEVPETCVRVRSIEMVSIASVPRRILSANSILDNLVVVIGILKNADGWRYLLRHSAAFSQGKTIGRGF